MKRLLSAFVIIMTLGLQAAYAQGEDWEPNDISLGYGFATLPQLVLSSTSIVASFLPKYDFADLKITDIGMKTTGSFNFEYNRRFTKTFSMGLALGYEKDEAQINGTGTAFGVAESGKTDVSMQSLSTMLNFRFFWFNKPHVSMYSKLAAGVSFILDHKVSSDNSEVQEKFNTFFASAKILPALQVSAVCIDFGGTALRGFVELGAGTQGSVVGGLRFRF